MNKNRVIQLRVTQKQYYLIQNRAEGAGYKSLSQFLRDLALKEDLSLRKLIEDIHREVLK